MRWAVALNRRKRVEEGLEHAGLAQMVEALPYAVPRAETLRQSAPANVLDGERVQRFEKAAIILRLPPTARQASPKHRQRVRPIVLVHPRRHRLRPSDSVGVP